MLAVLLFVVLFFFLIIGVPIAVSLGFSSLIFTGLFSHESLAVIPQKIFSTMEHSTLLSIPFFIMSSHFLTASGVSSRLVDFAKSLVGWMHGGLAMSAVLASMFFAAISGSSPATVIAIGSILIPGMIKAGYNKSFAVGVVTTAGSMGILIPPSIPMIVYANAVEESVGKLFIAGIIPGIMMGTILLITTYVAARIYKMPRSEWQGFRYLVKSGLAASPGLILVLIIVMGIYSGAFTPTEASAVAAVYSIAIYLFNCFKKEKDPLFKVSLLQIPKVVIESSRFSAILMFIISCAMIFAHVLTENQIPQNVSRWVVEQSLSPGVFLLIVNVVLWFAGDFMEPSAILLILAPLFHPIAVSLGIDPIHLGIIMTTNMEVGMITPPVGLNIYVAASLSGMSLYQVTKAAFPWMFVLALGLLVITYVPILSTFLVDIMF